MIRNDAAIVSAAKAPAMTAATPAATTAAGARTGEGIFMLIAAKAGIGKEMAW